MVAHECQIVKAVFILKLCFPNDYVTGLLAGHAMFSFRFLIQYPATYFLSDEVTSYLWWFSPCTKYEHFDVVTDWRGMG